MVDKNLIKRLILEYQDTVSNINFRKRNIEVDVNANNVFVGLRRAGKSYLLYQCIHDLINNGTLKEEILFVNFEDDRLPELNLSDLETIKQCYSELFPYKPIFFLDEIQNIEGWEKFVRRLADTGFHVFITGSNSNMLSSQIASTLGGRFILTEVFPYSFKEYLTAKDINLEPHWELRDTTHIMREFHNYFLYGGLPEQINTPKLLQRNWLSGLFDRIYFGDIIVRNKVRKPESLRIMVRKLIESIGKPISVNRISSIVSESGDILKPDTAKDYLNYTNESWLTFELENYEGKLIEKINFKKYYFVDNGLVTIFKDGILGLLLENLVAIHLRRNYRDRVFYYKNGVEVDFYLPDEKIAIQVSYSLLDEATKNREIKALSLLKKRFPVEKAYIITAEEESEIQLDDNSSITVVPIWKWLLYPQS